MKILLTNDDGIRTPGLRALSSSLTADHTLLVVAPNGPRSACGHSISLGRPIRVKKIKQTGGDAYAVDGTPVDCVKFALAQLGFAPDLILSGVNLGPNTGVSVFYSGTVSAAREGLFMGVPSMAVSMAGFRCKNYHPAVHVVERLIRQHAHAPLSPEIMLNINVPVLPMREIRGVKATRQAPSRFVEEYVRENARKTSYRLNGEISLLDPDGTSDEEAVMQGFISVSPLHIDLTAYHEMENFRRWFMASASGNTVKKNGQNTFKLY